MKTRYIVILIAFCILVVAYVPIITVTMGPEDVFNIAGVLYFPSIVIQLVANEGNGIICVDACGPCSAWSTYYVMIDGECVNGPDGRVCSNDAFGEQWRFFDGKCSSFVPERIPYEFSNAHINSKIASCNEISTTDQVCNPLIRSECPDTNDVIWKWGDLYELCFKIQNQSYSTISECGKITPQDTICNSEQNRHLCPKTNEDVGWSYNNLDKLCYSWNMIGK